LSEEKATNNKRKYICGKDETTQSIRENIKADVTSAFLSMKFFFFFNFFFWGGGEWVGK